MPMIFRYQIDTNDGQQYVAEGPTKQAARRNAIDRFNLEPETILSTRLLDYHNN